MMKKTLCFGLAAAAAVLLFSSGAAQVTSRGKEPGTRTARLADPEARTAAVIPGPPAGWMTPVNISNLPAGSFRPTLAVDNNGKAYVSWEEWYGGTGAPRSMCFNTNTTGSWGTSYESWLSYVAIDDSGYATVACDPSDGTGFLGYHDADWQDPRQPNMEIWLVEFAKGVNMVGEGWVSDTEGASDYTTLAVDPNTRELYVMWFDDLTGTDTFELVYNYRDPATKEWSYPHWVPIYTGRSKYWRDMVIDKSGTAHLVFNLRSPTDTYYTKNPTPHDDSRWTAPVSVTGNTDLDWTQPRLAVDDAGDVYVTWCRNAGGYNSGTEEVYFRRTVGGVWQAPENISNSTTRSGGEFGPAIAVDPESKDIWVAWHEFVDNANWEIYLRMYTDQTGGGKAWGDIYNMTNNPTESAEPSLKTDAQGGLHLVYYDSVGSNREILYTQKPGIGPPINIAVNSTLNAAEDQKTNTVSWAANPSNASLSITGYKVYYKIASNPDSSFAPLTQVSNSTFSHAHSFSSVNDRYAYRVASLTSGGAEGPSATVNDKPGVFAPINVALTTVANKVLFYEIKDNTVTFAAHGFNAPADVAGYDVYRRMVKEDNAALKLVGSSTALVRRYTDAQIKGGQKYAYAVKTRFKDGRVGNFSAIVAEN